jgi:sporulation protein YlmC with PRC-barrel domain
VTTGNDAGLPIAYEALASGTPVHDRDGKQVGTIEKVLADEQEDVFDGLVIRTSRGMRFIDAPDVGHIAERRVDLKLTEAEVAEQPEHETGGPVYRADVPSSRWQDLLRRVTFHRLWRKR